MDAYAGVHADARLGAAVGKLLNVELVRAPDDPEALIGKLLPQRCGGNLATLGLLFAHIEHAWLRCEAPENSDKSRCSRCNAGR